MDLNNQILYKMLSFFKAFNKLYLTIIIWMIVFVIPVISLHIPVMHNEEMAKVLLKTQWYDDYYCLIKVIVLYCATILLFFLFLFKRGIKVRLYKGFLLLVPYVACLLLSMYFSEYKISALFGIVDHFEGGLTQLCYICILVFSYYLIDNASSGVMIFKAMLNAALIVSIIGLLQFTGFFHIERAFEISSTIGNSNYVGTYAVLLLPVAFLLVLMESNQLKKICYILFYFGSALFLLIGSRSRAGYVGFIVIIPVLLALLWKEIRKQYILVLLLIAYSFVILVLMNVFSNGSILEEIKGLNPFYSKSQDKLYFKDIELSGDNAVIETNKWVLKLKYTGESFEFQDDNGEDIAVTRDADGHTIRFIQEPYSKIVCCEVIEKEYSWLMLKTEKKDIEFIHISGRLKIIGYNGKVTDIQSVESFGFNGKESFASGRGYIWSRSIPLLKKAIFIGYGPDTFTYIFPQNDIVGKINYGAIWVIIGKPHSWYLQTALGSGLFSLFCLIALIIWYMIDTVKYITNENRNLQKNTNNTTEEDEKRLISASIMCCIIGYCITGIFNDSVVAVSPIFWLLLGIGIRLVSEGFHNGDIK